MSVTVHCSDHPFITEHLGRSKNLDISALLHRDPCFHAGGSLSGSTIFYEFGEIIRTATILKINRTSH